MSNHNEKTGVRFGYISSDLLDSDIVNDLMEFGTDFHYEQYMQEMEKIHGDDFDEYRASDDYCQNEPTVEGTLDGVVYASSWLGVELNFFILESPVIVERALCSPACVPDAGDLGTEGEFECYGVPVDWLREKKATDAAINR